MNEVFLGSDVLGRGVLTRSRLRWSYESLYPDVYVRNDVAPSLRQHTGCLALPPPAGSSRDALISDDELDLIDGMAVTNPARTVFDLAVTSSVTSRCATSMRSRGRLASKPSTCLRGSTAIAARVAGAGAGSRWT
jgi:hypothetical protein